MKTIFTVLLLLLSSSLFAQLIVRRDPLISSMVNELSSQQIEKNIRTLVGFGTRHSLSDTLSGTKGIGAAREWIRSELQSYSVASGNRMIVEFDTFVQPADGRRIQKDITLKNVLARIPGTDPNDDRIFIVSGHYDSRASDVNDPAILAPGANDDASGTAAVIEMARVMSKHQFKATIVFVAMVAEEQGLYGAANLAKRARDEKWNVAGMITNDIIGNTHGTETDLKDNRSVRIFSEGVPANETASQASLRNSIGSENDGDARQLARYFKEIGERYVDQLEVKLIYRRDRYLRGGDHTPFSQQGFPAIRVTEMNENFDRQHQTVRTDNGRDYGDLPDFVDFNYVRKVTAMNLSALANLALSPPEPVSPGIITSQLTNKTELKWEHPKGEEPAGYYLLIRETSSPIWERKIFVQGRSAVLNYSKDNYFFGIQSVDALGHESRILIPVPKR